VPLSASQIFSGPVIAAGEDAFGHRRSTHSRSPGLCVPGGRGLPGFVRVPDLSVWSALRRGCVGHRRSTHSRAPRLCALEGEDLALVRVPDLQLIAAGEDAFAIAAPRTEVTGLVCPLRKRTSGLSLRPTPSLHRTQTVSSAHPIRRCADMRLPSPLHAQQSQSRVPPEGEFTCPCPRPRSSASGQHCRRDAFAIAAPRTAGHQPVCSLRERISWPLSASQIFSVWSTLPERMRLPSPLHAQQRTAAVCP